MKATWQKQLVLRIKNGEHAAERELLERYRDPIIWKILKSIQKSQDTIHDVAGEVWLALISELQKDSFDPDRWASLDAFVYGVTKNKVRDWFSAERRRNSTFKQEESFDFVAAAVEEFQYEEREIARMVRQALEKLPEKYRRVLELRYYEERTIQEMSAELDLPPRPAAKSESTCKRPEFQR